MIALRLRPLKEIRIISAYTVQDDKKNYVLYKIEVNHLKKSRRNIKAGVIERRYTQFRNLFNELCIKHPDLMSSIKFPSKALRGNFGGTLVASRANAFETLLMHSIKIEKLRSSKALLNFFQEPNLGEAKQMMLQGEYMSAATLFENLFAVLNNIYTDRTPQVLLVLCRLVTCHQQAGSKNTLNWAEVALSRFEGVSDSDLLILYVPLISMCINLWESNGKSKDHLERKLESLKRQGINCEGGKSLLEMVEVVEDKSQNHE